MKFPIMTTLQARKLVGTSLKVGGRQFVFENDIKAGGQAIAIPLKNSEGKRIAYFRSMLAMGATPEKIERTAWMMGQRLHLLSEVFLGAPQLWVNTASHGRPARIDFDFAGTIYGLALGTSWSSWKQAIELEGGNEPSAELRLQFARSLIQRLACLETFGPSGFVHGDISDANVMVDAANGSVNLIDFDCFIFESPTLKRSKLTVRDGGSKGTSGYIPHLFREDASLDLAPLGDRFSRDMLLIELLGFTGGIMGSEPDPFDSSPLYWVGQEEILVRIKRATTSLQLTHLQDMSVFDIPEAERPSSFELARRLGLEVENNVHQTLASPPALPNEKPAQVSAETKQKAEQPAAKAPLTLPSFEMPALEELPRLLPKLVDKAVIAIGKFMLPLMILALSGLVGVAAVLLWIALLVYLLFSLSLPINLIVCGVLVYLTFVMLEKFKGSEC